ncbi:MAG: glycosyltransferase family A protein [Planctomycetota bacterium]|nr:glycosyltransferase family A protein [Planctomycetota bacterium]
MHRSVGIVAIGRNEGARLEACLDSVVGRAVAVVYVDSGSTDASVEAARARGVDVVELDDAHPFTAARARNAGLERLLEVAADVEFVQFVDGDCEVVDGWLAAAAAALQADANVAAVCGRRRERAPEASVYNLICDIEWDRPAGEADECGGDAMMRVASLRAVGGFNGALIAGEEPELCVRLRARGQRVLRLAAEMTRHDAAMTTWTQWWSRATRGGYAFALVHSVTRGAIWGRQLRSILAYTVGLPVAVIAAAVAWTPWALAALAAPVIGVLRIRARERADGRSARAASAWAWSCMLGKLPGLFGVLAFQLDRARGKRRALIEYKR